MAQPISIWVIATAIDEAMGDDPVDVLLGDYLAEVTLAACPAEISPRKGPHESAQV
jgi:hypothetical protein